MIMEATEHRLPEGWHNTESYGEVFVSPGGIAWVVQIFDDQLCSVSVPLSKKDIIGKSAVERRAAVIKKQVQRTKGK
jgi:hypothetical protein